MMGRGFGYGYNFGPYGCGFLPFLIVFVIAGIIFYLIMKYHQKSSISMVQGSQALEILNKRLVNGEITLEEYEKIKKVIQ